MAFLKDLIVTGNSNFLNGIHINGEQKITLNDNSYSIHADQETLYLGGEDAHIAISKDDDEVALIGEAYVSGNLAVGQGLDVYGDLRYQAEGTVSSPAFGGALTTTFTTTIRLNRSFNSTDIVYLYITGLSSTATTVASGVRGCNDHLFGYIGTLTATTGSFNVSSTNSINGGMMTISRPPGSATTIIKFKPTYLAITNPRLQGIAICPSTCNKYFNWESIPEKYKILLK